MHRDYITVRTNTLVGHMNYNLPLRDTSTVYKQGIAIVLMYRLGTVREIFALFVRHRKFYMFPIIILLIIMVGLTALTQTGLAAFVYPI